MLCGKGPLSESGPSDITGKQTELTLNALLLREQRDRNCYQQPGLDSKVSRPFMAEVATATVTIPGTEILPTRQGT